MQCTSCQLAKYRSKIVIGRGDPLSAKYLFLGEAPGMSENVLGEAFIGESGKLLDIMITKAGILLLDCFFTNTVLCRPCDSRDGKNREPKKEEVFACLQNVQKIINSMLHLEIVFFAGRVGERYYASRLKGTRSVYIAHPSSILKYGGKSSSIFIDTVNTIRRTVCSM